MDDKNFVVLGIPRSGTKFFCKSLNERPNIWVPSWNSTYEPFNLKRIEHSSEIFKSHLFDHNNIVKKLISAKKDQQKAYMGFKTFLIWHRDFKDVIEQNQLRIIIVIRKNFWKVFGSFLMSIENADYTGSSKRFSPFLFCPSNRENRRIIDIFNNFCYQYWQLENDYSSHKNLIDKIYFEDFTQSTKFEKLNDYFDDRIHFQNDYNDLDSVKTYFANFEQLKSFVVEHCRSAPKHYGALPDYFLENLGL